MNFRDLFRHINGIPVRTMSVESFFVRVWMRVSVAMWGPSEYVSPNPKPYDKDPETDPTLARCTWQAPARKVPKRRGFQ